MLPHCQKVFSKSTEIIEAVMSLFLEAFIMS